MTIPTSRLRAETDSPMHILITRPKLQANKTALALQSKGHTCDIEPLLTIEHIQTSQLKGDFKGLIITSSNVTSALSQLAAIDDLKPLPVLSTGKTTQDTLHEAGFENVENVQGSALTIADNAKDWMKRQGLKENDRILYPCAEVIAHDLSVEFRKRGLVCVKWPVYRSVPSIVLSDHVRDSLSNNEYDAVLLYSKRTAETFVSLLNQMASPPDALFVYALSKDIVAGLTFESQLTVNCPKLPSEDALLALLDDA